MKLTAEQIEHLKAAVHNLRESQIMANDDVGYGLINDLMLPIEEVIDDAEGVQ